MADVRSGRVASRPKSKVEVEGWRDKFDYSAEYYKRNPGLFGVLYFCSQCAKPIVKGSKVKTSSGKLTAALEVDHVFPPSYFAVKKYKRPHWLIRLFSKDARKAKGDLVSNTSLAAELFNRPFNLVACCHKCNRKKSDKKGWYLVRGSIAKLIEVGLFGGQKVATVGLTLGTKAAWSASRGGIRIIAKPLTGKKPWTTKAIVLAAYVGLVYYLIQYVS